MTATFVFHFGFDPFSHALLEGASTLMRPRLDCNGGAHARDRTYRLDAIKPNPRNAHTHPKKQIRRLADNIGACGFTVPVIIDENSTLLAGHCRFEAAKLLASSKYPPSGCVA